MTCRRRLSPSGSRCASYCNCALRVGSLSVCVKIFQSLSWVMLMVKSAGLLFRWHGELHAWFCNVATDAAVVHCTIHATGLWDKQHATHFYFGRKDGQAFLPEWLSVACFSSPRPVA